MKATIEAIRAEHAPLLVDLFQAAGVTCHCRWWHFDGNDYDWQLRCATDPETNRRELMSSLAKADPQSQGILAHEAGQALGWLKLSPPRIVQKLYQRRVYRTLDCFNENRDSVLVIGCMLVHPRFRRQGLAAQLIAGAIRFAQECGATVVEALPRCSKESLRDDELWMSPHSTLTALGFERVDGPDPYPVMRYKLP